MIHKTDVMSYNNKNYKNENMGHACNTTNINKTEPIRHIDCTDKACDSGLGIPSSQCGESFTNIYPAKDTHFSMNIPTELKDDMSPEKTWTSLVIKKKPKSRKKKLSGDSFIELKALDTKNKTSKTFVIYRNDKQQIRHINIIDYRSKHIPKVSQSNTLHRDDLSEPRSFPLDEKSQSPNCHRLPRTNKSTDNLCQYISQTSSLYVPQTNGQGNRDSKTLSRKLWKQLSFAFCCRKYSTECKTMEEKVDEESDEASEGSGNDASDEECEGLKTDGCDEGIENSLDGSKWKFNFDLFIDLTYLSSGSQGTVYTATFKNTTVALKKVRGNVIKRNEVNIVKLLGLSHNNVIKFIGVSEEIENYLVMEYCSHGQLFDCLHRDVRIPPQTIRCWASQICEGMSYLHGNDIIHRDLKSPNILIADDNILKIIDFEFSKDCSDSKILNSFVGTIAWMAPEILRQRVHTKKVDIWSYGVVLWEMITREVPYYGIEKMAILYGVAENTLRLPLCRSIPCKIKELLTRCWEIVPGDRPTFKDILDNFDDYFSDLEQCSQENFENMQKDWKLEIVNAFEEMNKEKISTSNLEAELIRRRTKELDDAKKIKERYTEKLVRVDELIEQLHKYLWAVDEERKRNENEWKYIEKLKQSFCPNVRAQENAESFFSLQCRNEVQNPRLFPVKSPKISAQNHATKKARSNKRNSMFEVSKSPDKTNPIRRKFSARSFKEKHGKSNVETDVPDRNKGVLKSPTKKTVSLETVPNENLRTFSLNRNQSNKVFGDFPQRDSSRFRNNPYSTMPTPIKSNANTEHYSGIVNRSFQGSNDCLAQENDLEKIKRNSNLLQIACFGTSASISDIQNAPEDSILNLNSLPYPTLVSRNFLRESICEGSQNEESQNRRDVNLTDESIIIRGTSGRTKPSTKDDSLTHDSIDEKTQILTSYSLVEKEFATKNLIENRDFLRHVNTETHLGASGGLKTLVLKKKPDGPGKT